MTYLIRKDFVQHIAVGAERNARASAQFIRVDVLVKINHVLALRVHLQTNVVSYQLTKATITDASTLISKVILTSNFKKHIYVSCSCTNLFLYLIKKRQVWTYEAKISNENLTLTSTFFLSITFETSPTYEPCSCSCCNSSLNARTLLLFIALSLQSAKVLLLFVHLTLKRVTGCDIKYLIWSEQLLVQHL